MAPFHAQADAQRKWQQAEFCRQLDAVFVAAAGHPPPAGPGDDGEDSHVCALLVC